MRREKNLFSKELGKCMEWRAMEFFAAKWQKEEIIIAGDSSFRL